MRALYAELKNQSRYVDVAYQGGREEIEGLRSSLEALRVSYDELRMDFEFASAEVESYDREVGNLSLTSLATGLGLIAVTSVSVVHYRKGIGRILMRAPKVEGG